MGMIRNLVPASSAFENVAPKDFGMSDNSSASPTADGKGLVTYNSGVVSILKYEKNRFDVAATVEMEGEGTDPALVVANKEYCVVARDSLPLVVFDTNLKPVHAAVALPEKKQRASDSLDP